MTAYSRRMPDQHGPVSAGRSILPPSVPFVHPGMTDPRIPPGFYGQGERLDRSPRAADNKRQIPKGNTTSFGTGKERCT